MIHAGDKLIDRERLNRCKLRFRAVQSNAVQRRLRLFRQSGPVSESDAAHIAEAPLLNNRQLLTFLFAGPKQRFKLIGILVQTLGNVAHVLQSQVNKVVTLAVIRPARHIVRSAPDSQQPLSRFNLFRAGENGRQQAVKL